MHQNSGYSGIQEDTEEQFTFRLMLRDWWRSLLHALRFRKIILLAALLGGLLGLAYALIKNPTYTAKMTFIVEEAKAGGGSLASAISGQIGLDLGGLTGGGGMLAGDNVLQLLKSRTFLKKTLLTPYGDSNTTISLADQYAEKYGWKDQWKNTKKVGMVVSFPVGKQQFTRLEDSLLQVIVKRLTDKELSIQKPDKKLGFFELAVSTRDELLSQLICNRLLAIASAFYVETKTQRLSNNVARLQHRADSLGYLLNRKTVSAAESERLLLDVNPAYSAPAASAEISSRNKLIQTTVYAEIIKNLEISRTALVQETPTVQVVDYPDLPLKKNEVNMPLTIIVGLILGAAIACIILIAFVKPTAQV